MTQKSIIKAEIFKLTREELSIQFKELTRTTKKNSYNCNNCTDCNYCNYCTELQERNNCILNVQFSKKEYFQILTNLK